ncbi:MAG: hypothetical protein WBI53_03290 [Paludibacter sp.]
MTEKEIKDKAEQIIEALTALSLGREPNMLSNDAFRKLSSHPNFYQIKEAYINYLQSFDGKVESADDIKKMFDFRMNIVNLFDIL